MDEYARRYNRRADVRGAVRDATSSFGAAVTAFETFSESRMNSPRFGTGISCPLAVFRVGWSFMIGVYLVAAKCIFCGKAPVTAEHIVSKWIAPVLADDVRESLDPDKHIFFSRTATAEQTREWNQSGIEFTAKCVCDPCNSGWMGTIETRARPFIEPMIRGQDILLSVDGQEAVANWLTLKAIVDRYAQSPNYPVAKEILAYFYSHHTPPLHWFIVLGAYNGSWPVRVATDVYDSYRLTGTRVPFYRPTNRRTLFTIAVAYFLGQVFAPEKPVNFSAGSHQSAFLIWPPSSSIPVEPIHWPPANILGDDSLETIDKMVDGLPR